MGNSGIRRSDFLSNDDYARAVHEAGGPGPNERFVADGLGEHTRLLQAIHGVNRDDRQELFQAEFSSEITERPHIFVKMEGASPKRPLEGECAGNEAS